MMEYSERELETWAELNSLNLTQFFLDTTPGFVIIKCKLNQMNCQYGWKLRQTFQGECLELQITKVIDKHVQDENRQLTEFYSQNVRIFSKPHRLCDIVFKAYFIILERWMGRT